MLLNYNVNCRNSRMLRYNNMFDIVEKKEMLINVLSIVI